MTEARDTLRRILAPIASLKLTVALFALSIFLIFAGTLAQRDMSNWAVVNVYFRHLGVMIPLQIFFPQNLKIPGGFPFPGGFLLGGLMLVNLLAAHLVRFRVKAQGGSLLVGVGSGVIGILLIYLAHHGAFGDLLNLADQVDAGAATTGAGRRIFFVIVGVVGISLLVSATFQLFGRRAGIVLLHTGVIFLLLSEPVTGLFAVESQMAILEGQTAQWSQDIREAELAVVDPASADPRVSPGQDWVSVVAQAKLRQARKSGQLIRDPQLPFDIKVDEYMTNSTAETLPSGQQPQATAGVGLRNRVVPLPDVTGVDSDQTVNLPAAVVSLSRDGQELGRYVVAAWIGQGQTVHVDGRRYLIELRFRRYYKPYSIGLIDFQHDKFVGTETPRNFSSLVHLTDPAQHEDREVLIYMNHPLRYKGETFYQSAFMQGDVGTILSVVKNPGAWIPYYSCFLVALGMTVHFGATLIKFVRRSTV